MNTKNSDSNDLDLRIYDKSVDKAMKTLTILVPFLYKIKIHLISNFTILLLCLLNILLYQLTYIIMRMMLI